MGKNKEVIKFDINGKEICRYYNVKLASDENGISIGVLRRAFGTDKSINGFKYSYSGRYSDDVDKSNWKFKCPYCFKIFETYNGLCKHVFRFSSHKCESKEQLLVDFAYGGIRPKCKCGCGEYTDISYEGGAHFCDYKLGHASRVSNNWGHNQTAINNSANTRRKQYEYGNRIQWNKGRKWMETYSTEQINKLKKLLSENIINRMNEKSFSLSSKLEDYFIDNFIKPLNIEFKRQYYIKEINQFCDIYIPSFNLVIECDGSFWHSDPRLFPNGPKYEYQVMKLEKDKIKNEYLTSHGFILLRFWEIDIKENKKLITESLNKILCQKGEQQKNLSS